MPLDANEEPARPEILRHVLLLDQPIAIVDEHEPPTSHELRCHVDALHSAGRLFAGVFFVVSTCVSSVARRCSFRLGAVTVFATAAAGSNSTGESSGARCRFFCLRAVGLFPATIFL